MPKPIPLPTQAELHKLFDYSLITGELYWKTRTTNRIKIGDRAGTQSKTGYLSTRVAGKIYLVHRLVWRWVTGEDPGSLDVDHRNEIKDCNAWHNLRVATRSQNFMNKKKSKGYSKTRSGKFAAKVQIHGVEHRLGNYSTEQEAAAAVRKLSLEIHGEFSRYTQERVGDAVPT